jgi:hypothetical protein
MRAMHKWEYCAVDVTTYREGSGGPPREFLEIRLPGAHRASVTHAFGSVGLLNQLGSEGWELVDVESGAFYLKRQLDKASAA